MIYTVLQKTLTFEEIAREILELVHQKELNRIDEKFESKIKEEILYLGYNISHKGTMYLIDTIKYIGETKDNEQVNNLKKEIYPYIALINKTTIHCEAGRLKDYFKFQELRKPSIKTVIQTILYKIEKSSIYN